MSGDSDRITSYSEVMDFSVEHGYRYLQILARNEEAVCQFKLFAKGFTHRYKSRRVPRTAIRKSFPARFRAALAYVLPMTIGENNSPGACYPFVGQIVYTFNSRVRSEPGQTVTA